MSKISGVFSLAFKCFETRPIATGVRSDTDTAMVCRLFENLKTHSGSIIVSRWLNFGGGAMHDWLTCTLVAKAGTAAPLQYNPMVLSNNIHILAY